MCLYGLNLNVSNMKGDIFVNFAIMDTVDIISLFLFFFLIEKVGRRISVLTAAAFAGVTCLSTIFPTVLGGSGECHLIHSLLQEQELGDINQTEELTQSLVVNFLV